MSQERTRHRCRTRNRKGIALRLAADGHDVAVNEAELEAVTKEIRETGRRSATITADVSDPDSVTAMVAETAAALGSLDAVVANAGIAQGPAAARSDPGGLGPDDGRQRARHLPLLPGRGQAREWASHGITVNVYCPGIVGTAMWDLIDEKLAESEGIRKKYSNISPPRIPIT